MRLFVALNLPSKERDKIFRRSRPLRDAGFPVRWVEAAQYHITLKFLGDVHPDRVPHVQSVLGRVGAASPAFRVGLGGFGAFPTIRKPRVLWLGADPTPALRCLKQDLEWALSECGFDREMRAFHPHVTLGRASADGGGGVFRGLDTLIAELEYDGGFGASKVDLMSSLLTREGPRYSVVSSSGLDQSG